MSKIGFLIMAIQATVLIVFFLLVMIDEIKGSIVIRKKYITIDEDDKDKFKYYRDIINEYTIGELGYIFHGKKKSKLLIMAELEYLKMIQAIDINNGTIKILKKEELRKSEKYIVTHYHFINDSDFDEGYFSRIERSLREKKVIADLEIGYNKILQNLYSIMFFLLFLGIFFVGAYDNVIFSLLGMTLSTLLALACFFGAEVFRKKTIIKKTALGESVYIKLSGLKNYLKHIGNFKDKNLDEITLWDEYILYAIILDESKEIIKDAKKELKELKDMVRKLYKT